MRRLSTLLAVGVLATAAFGKDYKEEVKEPVKHTFPAGATTIDVDNVNGSVSVVGDGGTTMRVEGEKIVRAMDKQELERGKREVTLDLNVKDGVAQVYVNGPFRNGGNRNNENHGFHDTDRREYEVTYNLTVHVPRNSAIRLHSVNDGVKAEETLGKFDVRTVNGSSCAGSSDDTDRGAGLDTEHGIAPARRVRPAGRARVHPGLGRSSRPSGCRHEAVSVSRSGSSPRAR